MSFAALLQSMYSDMHVKHQHLQLCCRLVIESPTSGVELSLHGTTLLHEVSLAREYVCLRNRANVKATLLSRVSKLSYPLQPSLRTNSRGIADLERDVKLERLFCVFLQEYCIYKSSEQHVLLSAVSCVCDHQLVLAAASERFRLCLPEGRREKCHVRRGATARVPPLQRTGYLDAGCPVADAVFVVTVVVCVAAADVAVAVFGLVLQSVVVAAEALNVVAAAAAALAVAVSAVEMFVFGVLVVHDVAAAVVAAGPQALPTAFARGRCFAVD